MKISGRVRQQLLAIGAAIAVGLFALDKLVLTPLTAAWKSRSAAIRQLELSTRNGRALLQSDTSTRAKWNEIRRASLPNTLSQAEQEILKAFDQWSAESRISVSSIKPQWKRGATEDFSVLECRVDAAGSLSAISRFLYEVERSSLAIRIEAIELGTRDPEGQQISLGLLVTGLRLAPLERRS